jgi:ketopantoate reductase
MHVLVIGAGVIGSIYGWALAASGHRVVHLVRRDRATALRDGLTLDVFDRRKKHQRNFRGLYKLNAVETLPPAESLDLVIVPVKHYALAQTLIEVVPGAGAADFLLLTQNWDGVREIDAILPRTRYIYGDAKAGGAFSRGMLVATLSALDIGSPEGELSKLAEKVAGLFAAADIETKLHSDMLHYLWVQYAMTGGTWAALVRAGSMESFLNDRNAILTALRAGGECLQVVRQRGVLLSQYPEAAPFLTNSSLRQRFYVWIMRRMFRHDEYRKRCSAHAFGDPKEIKTFYDDLISTAHNLGVSMPVMESYAEDIRRFASTGTRHG